MEKKKVLIGMSGGVDSSVAAYILREQGYEVTGFTMRLCENLTSQENNENTEAARQISDKLGISFKSMERQDEFLHYVVNPFVDDYKNGRTPNPCVECNRCLKFSLPGLIATGHYAVVSHEERDGKLRWCLKKSTNLAKDQSYFLHTLSQDALSRVIFPLGDMDKEEVRKIAEEQGFGNAHKKDSQDICFIPDSDHASFIEKYTCEKAEHGHFVDTEGNVLGEHKGIIKYTIGQRKGLGLALKKPMYVCNLDIEKNEVVLDDDASLFKTELVANGFNWVSMAEPEVELKTGCGKPFRALGRIRYRHKEAPCTVTPLRDGKVKVVFDEPQRAITAGQSLVLYDIETDNYVLGGGKIEKVEM